MNEVPLQINNLWYFYECDTAFEQVLSQHLQLISKIETFVQFQTWAGGRLF